jgi:hypothetical protein
MSCFGEVAKLMDLTVNEEKTRFLKMPKEEFTNLELRIYRNSTPGSWIRSTWERPPKERNRAPVREDLRKDIRQQGLP